MECPSQEDILLHLVNEFQDQNDSQPFNDHLEGCKGCQEKATALDRILKAMQHENEQGCDAVIASLMDYLDGEAEALASDDVKKHLHECDSCQEVYKNLTTELSYDAIMALDYTPSAALEQNIKKLLYDVEQTNFLADMVESLKKQVDDWVERIIPVLIPLRPAPAFLGNVIQGIAEIETTSTRDLRIDVGAPDRVVKLFSQEAIELDRQISGATGNVTFKNFVPATYKLQVEGFEITEIQLWP